MARVPTITKLIVLGMLQRRPTHGYDVQQYLRLTETDLWAGVLPGSIYSVLKTLQKDGFVRVKSIESAGHRTRAIYEITPQGTEELRRSLAEAWRAAPTALPGLLYAALTYVDQSDMSDAVVGLRERARNLEEALARWNRGEQEKLRAMPALPDDIRTALAGLQTAVFANGRAHMEADLALLKYLVEAIPNLDALNRKFKGGDTPWRAN